MEAERWRKIEQLCHLASEQPERSWSAFLAEACGGDRLLREEVESLLAQSKGTTVFLEAAALDVAARDLVKSAAPSAYSRPRFVGRYRTIRLLGGGMGALYEAEQEEPRGLWP